MDERDKELDALLSPLRSAGGSDLEQRKWRNAVREELTRGRVRRPWVSAQRLIPTAAALLIGFALGRFGGGPKAGDSVSNNEPSATIEYVYAKSE